MKPDDYWNEKSKANRNFDRNKADLHMTGTHKAMPKPTPHAGGSGLGSQIGIPSARQMYNTDSAVEELRQTMPSGLGDSQRNAQPGSAQAASRAPQPGQGASPAAAPNSPAAAEVEARVDAATGALSFSYFVTRLEQELVRARYFGRNVALLVVTLDGFDRIGLHHGPPAINSAAQGIALALLSGCRPVDLVGRLSECRFMVACPEISPDQTMELARLILGLCDGMDITHQWDSFKVSVSIGIAMSSSDIGDVESLLAIADLSADLATESGGNKVSIHGEAPS